jgi:hypothetical protein
LVQTIIIIVNKENQPAQIQIEEPKITIMKKSIKSILVRIIQIIKNKTVHQVTMKIIIQAHRNYSAP